MFRFLPELVRRVQYLLRKRQADAELREEMAAHLAMLSEEAGATEATRRLGNSTRWREIAGEVWGWSWLESIARDTLYAERLLRRSPGFTVTACLSLALGLGSTLGIFSLMNALLFKQLPVPNPEQLWNVVFQARQNDQYFTYRMFDGLRRANNGGIELFAVGGDNVQLKDEAGARTVPAAIVSGNAFPLLGLQMHLGRPLTPEDDIRGVPHGANCVLSDRLWRTDFHADPEVVGKHLSIGRQTFTIAGVAPPHFFGFYVGAYSEVFLSMGGYAATNPAQPILDSTGWSWLHILARVPNTQSVPPLVAKLNAVYPAVLAQVDPASARTAAGHERLSLESASNGLSAVRGRFAKPLSVLLAMTAALLLIACANLANLLLARSVVRSREIAIRLSVGAHRARIVRQLLTESALIGILGVCSAVPLYYACTLGLISFLSSSAFGEIFLDTRPDARLAAGVLGLLAATVLLFSLAPALRASRADLNAALSEANQRLAARTFAGQLVVAAQISLSLVLLLAAALLARSLFDLRTFDPGFRRDHLLIARIDTSQSIRKNAELIRFFDQFLQRVRALPGVRSAAASVVVPLAGLTWMNEYQISGRAVQVPELEHSFGNWVTPAYFETLGTPVSLGRSFDRRDTGKAPLVAVINQTFARAAFGASNPIGRQVFEKGKQGLITIVGLVGDARYRSLRDEAPPTLYRPVAQLPPSFDFVLTLSLEVWTNGTGGELRKPIDGLLHRIDPRATADFHTFDALIDSNLLFERLLTALSIAFGAVALFLAATGVYGLAAYAAARRTPEIGIRMALGATPHSILRLMLSEQLRLLAIAVAAGVAISLALTRFLQSWLFGVSANDPALYALALTAISGLALLAAFVPARRAARLNPLQSLRSE